MLRPVRLVAPAMVFVSFSSPLLAATAQEIWAEWQDLAARTGQTITAESEDYSGGTLTLRGLGSVAEFDGGKTETSIGEVRLVETGGGEVMIELDSGMQISSLTHAEGEEVLVRMTMTHQGLEIVASGEAESRKYAYSGASLVVRVDEVTAGDEAIPVDVTVTAQDFVSDYLIAGGDAPTVSSTANIGAVAVAIDFEDPGTGEKGEFDYAAKDLKLESNGSLSAFSASGDPSAMFTADTPTVVSMTHGGTIYDFDVDAGAESMGLQGSSTSGTFGMEMGNGGVAYDIASSGVSFEMNQAEIPVPIQFTAQETGASVRIPMVAFEAPQDIGISLLFGQLSVSEGLWGMIDPQGILPRDPADLVVDLAGTATLFTNLFEIEDPNQVPGELNSLSVNDLKLSLAGAELTGSGAFEVDNTSMGAIPGAPNLIGNLMLSANGVNGLIDNLAAAGLISNDDVMGARMMMGMVARPGDQGGDSLVSEIELKPGGGVVVNGMQLQ